MTEAKLAQRLQGREVHVRLLTNDLLEHGKRSATVIGRWTNEAIESGKVEERAFTEYSPQSLLGKLVDRISGRGARDGAGSGPVVLVEEKNGSLSADDARYVEWLGQSEGLKPEIVMVPEAGRHVEAQPHHILSDVEERKLAQASFWKRQWRRACALPAPITKDAALAAVPRTSIPVASSLALALLKRREIPMERAAIYMALAVGFALGFALFNQTVLNFITFWSEFTREALQPLVHKLEGRVGKVVRFVSARGDVLIAAPLLGIGCVFFARLALGAVGQTDSVLTFKGFLLVIWNVVFGSIAGGPYPQIVAHLRAVGKISDRESIYWGILDTARLELGRLADFGMQTLYNVIQAALAVGLWLLLLAVDWCFPKPEVSRLRHKDDVEAARGIFARLRGERAAAGVVAAGGRPR